jgi:hypothetical protein
MRNFSVQRSIATTALSFCKRLYAGSSSVWTFLGIFAVLVCASEIIAQEPGVIEIKEPEKFLNGADASKDTSSKSKVASKDEESKDQTEHEDPPRELITPEKSKAMEGRGDSNFKRAMLLGRRDLPSSKIIEEGIRVWVYRMTLKENQRKVRTEMGNLLLQIRSAARREKRIRRKKEFRTFVCIETVARAKELLDNNNEVRLNAAILISELNVMEPGSRNNPPAEAYSPGTAVLLEIIQDEKQPIPVKIQAARGITRNALLGVPLFSNQHKNDLVKSIVKELENAKKLSRDQAGPWYQARLLETLAAIDLPTVRNGDPLIFNTLESFLEDTKLDFSVRCMAARSLGRAHLVTHPQINVERLSLKLAKLGLDLTNGFNKSMRVAPATFPRWQKYFWDLYVAFHPENDYDKVLYRNRKLGLLAIYPNRKEIQDAYQKILPFAAHVLKQPEQAGIRLLPQNQIQALSNWIKNHPQAAKLPGVPPSTPVTTGSR